MRRKFVYKQYGTHNCEEKPQDPADGAMTSANYNIRYCFAIFRGDRYRPDDRGVSLDSDFAGNYKQRLPEMTSNEHSNGRLNASQREEMRTNPRGYFHPWA